MTEFFAALSPQYEILFVNRALLDATARSFENFVGHNHREIWPELENSIVEEAYERALRTGLPQKVEFRLEESGEWFEIVAWPREQMVLVYFRDISERKRMELEQRERENVYGALVNAMPQIAWSAEPNGNPNYFNERWYEFTGMRPGDPYSMGHFVHPDDLEIVRQRRDEAYNAGGVYEAHVRLRRHDGVYRWHLARAMPLRNAAGEIVRYFGTSTDIHDQRSSAQTSRAIVMGMAAPVIVFDAQGQIMAANEAWNRMYFDSGITGTDNVSVGQNFEIFRLDGSPLPREEWASTRALAGEATRVTLRLRHRLSGLERIASHHAVPIEVDGQRLIVVTGHDLTDLYASQEALRLSEQRLRGLLEAATVGVIVNDDRGRFTYANPPLLRMLGYTREDVEAGRLSWRMIQVPDRMPQDDVALNQLRDTGSCEPYETEFVARDGHRVPVYVGGAFLPNDTGDGLIGAAFVTDLTNIKQAEEELRSLNAELDHRVHERTAELRAANEALETFSHHVAHDLRSPLRAIGGTSRIIQEDFGAELSKDAQLLLTRQVDAANRLGQLIDDLLNIAKLTREELHKESVDFSQMARESAEEALAAHPHTKVHISVEPNLAAVADPRLLRLALVNLIENAVKYSPSGGEVQVGQRPGGVFFVSDQGIGIDMAYAAKIFQPFERLHRDSEFRGTGVGLSNVNQVISRHGGRIWLESEPGAGSTFLFTLNE